MSIVILQKDWREYVFESKSGIYGGNYIFRYETLKCKESVVS